MNHWQCSNIVCMETLWMTTKMIYICNFSSRVKMAKSQWMVIMDKSSSRDRTLKTNNLFKHIFLIHIGITMINLMFHNIFSLEDATVYILCKIILLYLFELKASQLENGIHVVQSQNQHWYSLHRCIVVGIVPHVLKCGNMFVRIDYSHHLGGLDIIKQEGRLLGKCCGCGKNNSFLPGPLMLNL
jgi:hypothetical protein